MVQEGDRQETLLYSCSYSFLNMEDKGVTLNVELVGIKNLKTTHNWRLEFDVYEIDSDNVKNIMDKLNKSLVMALVEYE